MPPPPVFVGPLTEAFLRDPGTLVLPPGFELPPQTPGLSAEEFIADDSADPYFSVTNHDTCLSPFGLSVVMRIRQRARQISWVRAYSAAQPPPWLKTHPSLDCAQFPDEWAMIEAQVLHDFLRVLQVETDDLMTAVERDGYAVLKHHNTDAYSIVKASDPPGSVPLALHNKYLDVLNTELKDFVVWWNRGGARTLLSCKQCGRDLPRLGLQCPADPMDSANVEVRRFFTALRNRNPGLPRYVDEDPRRFVERAELSRDSTNHALATQHRIKLLHAKLDHYVTQLNALKAAEMRTGIRPSTVGRRSAAHRPPWRLP